MKIATALTIVLCALGLLVIAHLQRELALLRSEVAEAANPAGRRPGYAKSQKGFKPFPADGHLQRRAGAAAAAEKTAADGSEARSRHDREERLSREIARERLIESINRAYGPLVKKLGLDPNTTAQFEGMVEQERLTALEVIQAEKAQGVTAIAAYLAAVQEALAPGDQQLETLLGPDNFGAFSDYRQTLPEQGTVSQLAERVATLGDPLTDGQQTQMVLLLDQLEPSSFRQNEAFLSTIGIQEVPLTTTMVNAAASLLSPPQAKALQAMQASLQARVAIANLLRSAGP